MNNITNQQLAVKIPKVTIQWDTQDILDWFQVNQIEIDKQIMLDSRLNGKQLQHINPEELMRKYGLTMFIAKRIVQWFEDEAQEFDQIIQQIQQTPITQQQDDFYSINYDFPDESFSQRIIRNQSTETNQNQHKSIANDNEDKQSQKNDLKVGKWQKNRGFLIDLVQNDSTNLQSQQQSQKNQYVKFVRSQLEILDKISQHKNWKKMYDQKLRIKSVESQNLISGDCKMGRNKKNHIFFQQQSVSRFHAEITAKKNNTNLSVQKYYFMDIGSKFGSFVPMKDRSQINLEDSYHFQDCQFTIISLINKGKTFDLKLLLNRQQQHKFSNKTTLIIGKKGDLKLPGLNSAAQCKIYIDKKLIFIESIDGILYRRLQPQQLWDIEQNAMPFNKTSVILGSLKISLQIIRNCINCLKSEEECNC